MIKINQKSVQNSISRHFHVILLTDLLKNYKKLIKMNQNRLIIPFSDIFTSFFWPTEWNIIKNLVHSDIFLTGLPKTTKISWKLDVLKIQNESLPTLTLSNKFKHFLSFTRHFSVSFLTPATNTPITFQFSKIIVPF